MMKLEVTIEEVSADSVDIHCREIQCGYATDDEKLACEGIRRHLINELVKAKADSSADA